MTATLTPTSLSDLIADARPNQLIADLAEAARAARLTESNRLARIATALVDEGNTETAVLLYQNAINLLTAA